MTMRSRTRGRVRGLVLATTATISFIAACQVLVPSDVPEYTCTGAAPSSCPSGLICDANTKRCVPPDDVSEGGFPDARPPGDASNDRNTAIDGGGRAPVGGKCAKDGDCMLELVCGTTNIVSSAVLGTGNPFCTKPCCTSSECPNDFVCFPSGGGGNYCVPGTSVSRTPATALPKGAGEPCGSSDECRSGLCQDGLCLDTCCSDANCGGGSACKVFKGAGTGEHRTWACVLGNDGGVGAGEACFNNLGCRGGFCTGPDPYYCATPCCKPDDCSSTGLTNAYCSANPTNPDTPKVCTPGSTTAGLPPGQACTLASQCASRFCDNVTKKCANTCCKREDCAESESCEPSPDGTPVLRCASK